MKLIELTMQAFGPFLKKQTVDFAKVSQSQIFLISGPTGSGKTTVFDGICFALYGNVSGGRKDAKTLKCSLAEPKDVCFVSLSFISNQKQYQIIRYPEQEKLKKDGGMTKLPHQAELILPDGERVTRLNEITRLMEEEIIGVSLQNFEKLIMLPQGQFQKLLLEQGKERTHTLRQIFGTQIFGQITEHLYRKARAMEARERELMRRCSAIVKDVNSLPEGVQEDEPRKAFAWLKKQNQKEWEEEAFMRRRVAELDKTRNHAQEELIDAKKVQEAFTKLSQCKQERMRLSEFAVEMSALKKRVDELEQVKEMLPVYQNQEIARQQLTRRKKQLEESQNALKLLQKDWEQAFKQSEKIPELQKSLQQKQQRLFSLRQEIQKERKQKELHDALKSVETQIGRLEEQTAVQQAVQTKKDLLEQMARTEEKAALCEAQVSLKKELKEAEQAYQQGMQLLLETQSGVLASQLQEGQPCPVCGSRAHPKMAVAAQKASVKEVKRLQEKRDILFRQVEAMGVKLRELASCSEKDLPMPKLSEVLENVHGVLKKHADAGKELLLTKDYQSLLDQKEIERVHIQGALAALNGKETAGLEELSRDEKALQKRCKELQQMIEMTQNNVLLLQNKQSAWNEKVNQFTAQCKEWEKRLEEETARLEKLLQAAGMAVAQMEAQKDAVAQLPEDRRRLQQYQEAVKTTDVLLKRLEEELAGKKLPDFPVLQQAFNAAQQEIAQVQRRLQTLAAKLAVNTLCEQNLGDCLAEMQNTATAFGLLEKLSKLAHGGVKKMSFEKYVLASYFDDVIAYANLRMEKMSQFRYRLARVDSSATDGLSLEVFDVFAGNRRPINTLSGGEIFVASLSLSLGLADMVSQNAGGVWLGTMLIDEGFGALDSEYLDRVIECLMHLQDHRRQIGIISHVEELKERMQNQIVVKQGGASDGSTIWVAGQDTL